MPVPLTYPGVYIEEVPSAVRTITGVATSITGFIGRTLRGPANDPVRIQSFADFTRVYGGLWRESPLSYAVQQFFQHGGSDAIIVRLENGAATATISLPSGAITLAAASPGNWGNALRATVNYNTRNPADTNLFNLIIEEVAAPGSNQVIATETFLNLSIVATDPRFVTTVLAQESTLARVQGNVTARPDASTLDGSGRPVPTVANNDGTDGNLVTDTLVQGDEAGRTGIFALEDVDLFNLLCIPPLTPTTDVADATWAAAANYCQNRRAMLLIDPPSAWTANPSTAISTAQAGVNTLRTAVGSDDSINAIVYFPRLRLADPLNENRLGDFAPSGAIAGIIARTDAQRGVWKAPAGLDASFSGVREFTYKMTDAQNGLLNPLGLNSLRTFPVTGNVVWGARTLAGADQLASQWKYIPVRRLALYIEESLYRGTQWVVFEPNDEPLWAQIRLNVGSFMQDLFRQGAFQGASPREAFLVKCDKETTTQSDIDRGVVNILVGFAPLKPAEFVVIRIQQLTRQEA